MGAQNLDEKRSSYTATQSRLDREYAEAWREWERSLSSGELAALRARGLDGPALEKLKFGAAKDADEGRTLQERLPELARHDRTPYVELAEAEDRAEQADEQVTCAVWARVRNRHFHLFAMFMGTGVEQYSLLHLRAVIMLRCAAPHLLARYGLANGAATVEIRRLKAKTRTIAGLHDYVPLGDVLGGVAEEDEVAMGTEMALTVRALRLMRFGEFCEEIAARTCAASLDQWAKNAVTWIRRTMPDEIGGLGESQTAIARKGGEQRATVSAREIRLVEEPMRAAGAQGYHLLGGTKSDTHRKRCAAAQKGNTNRRDGEERKRREAS